MSTQLEERPVDQKTSTNSLSHCFCGNCYRPKNYEEWAQGGMDVVALCGTAYRTRGGLFYALPDRCVVCDELVDQPTCPRGHPW